MSVIHFLQDNQTKPRPVSPVQPLPVMLPASVPAGSTGDTAATAALTTLNANLNTGVATANSSLEFLLLGASTLTFQVVGTWTGTLLLQGSVDGINWVTIAGLLDVTSQSLVNSIASGTVGIWQADVAGFAKVRLTCSAAMTGTANVSGVLSNGNATFGLDAPVTLRPSALEGASTFHHLISAGTVNATSAKGTPGTLNVIVVTNINAAARFLKLYNKASAPTVGTDTPVMTILVPANSTIVVPCGPAGMRFSIGIAYALTTGITVADTGVVNVSEHSVNLNYT